MYYYYYYYYFTLQYCIGFAIRHHESTTGVHGRLITLQYCIGLAIHQHESATGVNPELPSHFPPHTIPLCHPSAPAPSILYPALNLDWLFVSYMILYMFQCHSPKSSHPHPLPTESKRLFFTSVSLLLSHIQGYRYCLSKFHIYAQIWPWNME